MFPHRPRLSSLISNVHLTHLQKNLSQVQASAADTDAVPVPSSASLSSPGDPALPPVSWGMNFTFDVDALVAGADADDTASASSALLPSENALSVSLFCTAVVRLQGVIHYSLDCYLICTSIVILYVFFLSPHVPRLSPSGHPDHLETRDICIGRLLLPLRSLADQRRHSGWFDLRGGTASSSASASLASSFVAASSGNAAAPVTGRVQLSLLWLHDLAKLV